MKRLKCVGGKYTASTSGKVLVLPTGDSTLLPAHNEYTLNTSRLTIAESPWGGIKGTAPDYSVGSVHVTSGTNIVLTDVAGNNEGADLSAGKLKELSYLTVDTSAHTITTEFIIKNSATSTNSLVKDSCVSATGWSFSNGSGSISIENEKLKVVGTTDSNGYIIVTKTYTAFDLTNYSFLTFDYTSETTGSLYAYIGHNAGANYIRWALKNCTAVSANVPLHAVYPIKAPVASTTLANANPNAGAAIDFTRITDLRFGFKGDPTTQYTFYIDNICFDNANPAYVEINTPDYLADASAIIQCWDGSAYQPCRTCKLDSVYADISSTPANVKFLDTTKLDDVYGSGLGRSIFPRGEASQTVVGSLANSSITYSSNAGTKCRVGLLFYMPPSDGGRTVVNQIRLKIILSYTDAIGNTVYDLSSSGLNASITGVFTKKPDSFYFNSDTAKITVPARINSILSPTGYTVVVDCKPESFTTNYYDRTLFCNFTNSTGLMIGIGNAKLNTASYNTTTTTYFTSTGNETLIAGTRYTFIVTVTPTSVYTYVNSHLDSSAPSTTIDLTNTGVAVIGNHETMPTRAFKGDIYGIYLYNSAWNQDQVTAYINNKTVPTNSPLVYGAKPSVLHYGSTTVRLANGLDASTGLLNLSKTWIALYDPTKNKIDFFLHTDRPNSLSFKRDETGNIYEVTLSSGNGLICHGQLTHPNTALDSDSNLIPDVLEESIEGSVTKFLQTCDFSHLFYLTSDNEFYVTSDTKIFEVSH